MLDVNNGRTPLGYSIGSNLSRNMSCTSATRGLPIKTIEPLIYTVYIPLLAVHSPSCCLPINAGHHLMLHSVDYNAPFL